jgi:hypothetical protein
LCFNCKQNQTNIDIKFSSHPHPPPALVGINEL